jgi:hypothetical protein
VQPDAKGARAAPADNENDPTFDLFTNFKIQKQVFHQGNINSCVCNAIATAYIYETQIKGVKSIFGNTPCSFIPSRLFLYYFARVQLDSAAGPDWNPDYDSQVDPVIIQGMAKKPPTDVICRDKGTNIQKILNIIKNFGVPEEQDYRLDGDFGVWPYQEKGGLPLLPPGDMEVDFTHDPNDASVLLPASVAAQPPNANTFLALYRHLNIQHMELDVTSPTIVIDWKKTLVSGLPIIFAIAFIESLFEALVNDHNNPDPIKDPRIMPSPGPNDVSDDGHIMLAVGWNDHVIDINGKDQGGCFLIQNSWGDYTPGGTFWMPYTFFTTSSGNPNENMVTFSIAMIGTTVRDGGNEFIRF